MLYIKTISNTRASHVHYIPDYLKPYCVRIYRIRWTCHKKHTRREANKFYANSIYLYLGKTVVVCGVAHLNSQMLHNPSTDDDDDGENPIITRACMRVLCELVCGGTHKSSCFITMSWRFRLRRPTTHTLARSSMRCERTAVCICIYKIYTFVFTHAVFMRVHMQTAVQITKHNPTKTPHITQGVIRDRRSSINICSDSNWLWGLYFWSDVFCLLFLVWRRDFSRQKNPRARMLCLND